MTDSFKYFETSDELRSFYKPAHDRALHKELRRLDTHSRKFLELSPFVLIGSQDSAGNGDVTPKGDRPGFVAILDDTTIAIPDRPGNNRLDTLENLITNPAVGLLFLIPGMNETLRINGQARITADPALCERLAVDGRLPAAAIVVKISAVYMHCAKAFMRSQLWSAESWPPRSAMPTLGQIINDQINSDVDPEETDREIADIYAKTMW